MTSADLNQDLESAGRATVLHEGDLPASAPPIAAYFLTGTGRCGTMLLSKVLSMGLRTHCNHEHSVPTLLMKESFIRGEYTQLEAESMSVIGALIARHAAAGRSYGECSSHVFPLVTPLASRLGARVRFGLVVRRPDTFVGSALARGFFDPSHPKPCEHIRPTSSSETAAAWPSMSPFEKCLWYWNTVNARVLESFDALPPERSRVFRLEEFGLTQVRDQFSFFGIKGFRWRYFAIRSMLAVRVNASPGQGDDRALNPWSVPITLADISAWTDAQREALLHYAGATARRLYPEWMAEEFGNDRRGPSRPADGREASSSWRE